MSDQMRDELQERLETALRGATYPVDIPTAVDGLLPIVLFALAEELTMAADALEHCIENPEMPWAQGVAFAVEQLLERAEAIEGQTGRGGSE